MTNDLGTLGGAESSAQGINDEGLVVGSAQAADGIWRAFIWMPDSGMKQLDIPGATWSSAIAINHSGQVVGNYTDEAGNDGAFIWAAGVGAQAISSPYPDSVAEDINASGQVLLTAYNGEGPTSDLRIMIWSANDGLRDLASPYPDTYVSVHALTDDGDIIGWMMDPGPMSGGGEYAFILSKDGGATILPCINPSGLVGGDAPSHALAVNRQGQIVGCVECAETDTHAWLWTPRVADPARDESVRLQIHFTDLGWPWSKPRSVSVPQEAIAIAQETDFILCRFTGIDSRGRPKRSHITLDPSTKLDGNAERVMRYDVLQRAWGDRKIYRWRPTELPSHRMTDLGTLNGLKTTALGINDAGQVVGSALDQDAHHRAFYWSEETGMVDLGTLGGASAAAFAINAAGVVAGWAEDSQSRKRAFVWQRGAN